MERNTIHTFAKWQVKEGHLQTVLNLLPAVVEKSRAEKGNHRYEVFQSNTNAHTILLFETYKDQEALDAHRNSAYFQEIVLQQIVPLLEQRAVELSHQIL